VFGDPDRVISRCQSWPGRSNLEEPGPPAARLTGAALDQLALANHPQHSLLVDRPPQLPPYQAVTSGSRGRVALGDLNDRQLNLVNRWPASSVRSAGLGDAVDSLAADREDAPTTAVR